MRTREDCKKGKDGREESRLPEFQLRGFFFWQSSPKKSPKNAFLTIGYDIVKYAKT